jgi:hypothetical protein
MHPTLIPVRLSVFSDAFAHGLGRSDIVMCRVYLALAMQLDHIAILDHVVAHDALAFERMCPPDSGEFER